MSFILAYAWQQALVRGSRSTKKTTLLIAISVTLSRPSLSQTQPSTSDRTQGTSIPLGQEVTVQGSRGPLESKDVVGSVTLLGAEALGRESVHEPLDLLRRLPGVSTEQYNQGIISSDVGVRGFNSQGDVAPLKLLIDGIPSNIHEGVADLKPIFPLEIQRLEMVRGTADPRYGMHAVAGNLNVHTQRGGNGSRLRGVAGSFDTFEAQASSAFEDHRFSTNLFGGFRYSGGYREHSQSQKYALSGKWFYKYNERLSVGVIGRLFRIDANAPGYLTLDAAREAPRSSPWVSRTDGGVQHNRHLSLHWEWRANARTVVSLKSYVQSVRRQRWVRFTEAADQQERIQSEVQGGAVAQVSWRLQHLGPIEELRISGGLDFQHQDNFNARYQTDNYRNRVARSRHQTFNLLNYGGYAHVEARPKAWFGISAGLRWDRVTGDFTSGTVESASTPMLRFGTLLQPKASAFVTPWEGYRVYANYGRSAQLPVRDGLYSTANLTWSKNDGWEVGAKLRPWRWLSARGAYFRQTASSEIRELFNSTSDFENVGETLRQGIDSELTLSPVSWLSGWAAYTYQRAQRVNPGANLQVLKGTELNHVPRYLLKLGIDLRLLNEKLWGSVWLLSQGDYSLTNGSNYLAISPSTRLGSYSILNLDLSYDVDANALGTLGALRLGAHIKNLLNVPWQASMWNDGAVTLTNPGDGLTALASVESRF